MAVVSSAVLEQLTRLGLEGRDPDASERVPLKTIRTSFYRPAERCNWSEDPLGQVTDVPPAVRFVMRIRGDGRYRGYYPGIEFIGQSEGYDGVDHDDQRHVLVPFAMDADSHHGFYVDLLDESDEPAVWERDGDRIPGKGKLVVSTGLVRWLRRLRRA